MKIESLHIFSDYKNLRGLEINFKKEQSTYVLIGNNGVGKSNILEAISSIFRGLYYDKFGFEFDFNIRYVLDDRKIVITHKQGALRVSVNDHEIGKGEKSYLPKRIVCNYSGEDSRLNDFYYKPLYDEYLNALKRVDAYDTLKMFFVDKQQWKYVMLIMLATRNNIDAFDKFLTDVIKLPNNNNVRIIMSIKEDILKGWSRNPATFYFEKLLAFVDKNGIINVDNINFKDDTAADLFSYYICSGKLIEGLKLVINGFDSSMLSEGEKKMMVVEFILEAISDESSLVLLDEPDSHIHVSRKVELKDYLEATPNRENIITSHSPSLAAAFNRDAIVMLTNEDGNTKVVDDDKRKIVETLTNDIWTLQEQNLFLTSNKDILIVEGITDERYLKTALKVFHEKGEFMDLDLDYLPCGGAANVDRLISKFKPKDGQLAIAIWDNDSAGQKAMRKVLYGDNSKKKLPYAKKVRKVWYTFYPTWKRTIENFNIEDYFTKDIIRRYIKYCGFSNLPDKTKIKEKLSLDCTKGVYGYDVFRHFEKLFILIEQIKQADKSGKKEMRP